MTPVTDRLAASVRRDFESGSAEPVLSALTQFDSERVQAAVVLIANGSWRQFRQAVTLAERDWRDALVTAGLEGDDWRFLLDGQLGPEPPRI